MAETPSRPRAFVASCAFGAAGVLLLMIGFVSGSEPLLVAAAAAGSLSLASALVWRSQLVDAWHGPRRGRSRPPLT